MQSLNVYFTGPGRVELRHEPVSEPGAGQLLVRSRCSLISSGTECICLERNFEPGTHWDQWVRYPFAPGYSTVGEVVAVGAGVSDWRVGDRVVLRRPHRQYHIVSAEPDQRGCPMRVPDALSDEEAAWFSIANIVQNGIRRAAIQLGEHVVVVGLGILGQLAVQYARICGAWQVIGIDPAEPRCRVAAEHGATAVLPVPVQEARPAVEELTDGRLADVVMDVTGFAPVFATALGLTRCLGRFIVLGDTGYPSQQHLTSDLIRQGIAVLGAHDVHPPAQGNAYYWWSHAHMTALFFELVRRGQMRVADLVTHRYPATEAPQAYAMLTRDRSAALGVILDWTEVVG